jgi:DMSO reductase family type II enzyme chaperone
MREATSSPASSEGTRARAAIYRLLAEPFTFPAPQRTADFANGSWAARIGDASNGLDYPLELSDALSLDADEDTYEVEFIALHEVGLGGAPCPLHSGHHARDRMRSMEEVVRFYRFFDFHPQRSPDRYPDHVTFELEFMAHLADRQQDAECRGGDIASPIRAQRDFLARHLLPWLPQLVELIARRSRLEFCRQTARLSHHFVTRDCTFLDERVRRIDCQHVGGRLHD